MIKPHCLVHTGPEPDSAAITPLSTSLSPPPESTDLKHKVRGGVSWEDSSLPSSFPLALGPYETLNVL